MPGLMDSGNGPKFNILGMLLGGRGYAANYFAERDERIAADMARKERGAFAQQLITSPEFQKYKANPYDREAQYGLWAMGQGGPEAIANAQVSYLAQGLQDIGQREDATYRDQLDRERIRLSSDEQLRVDQIKRDRDNQSRVRAMQQLQQAQPEVERNMLFDTAMKDTGFSRPTDMSVNFRPDGSAFFTPTTGSKTHQEMMGRINARVGIVDSLDDVARRMDENTLTKGDYNAIRFDTMNRIRAAEQMGSLDQGSVDQFGQHIMPEWSWGEVGSGPGVDKRTMDQMKTYANLQRQRISEIAGEYSVPIEMLGNAAAPNYRPRDIVPLAEQLKETGEKHPNAATGGARTVRGRSGTGKEAEEYRANQPKPSGKRVHPRTGTELP